MNYQYMIYLKRGKLQIFQTQYLGPIFLSTHAKLNNSETASSNTNSDTSTISKTKKSSDKKYVFFTFEKKIRYRHRILLN